MKDENRRLLCRLYVDVIAIHQNIREMCVGQSPQETVQLLVQALVESVASGSSWNGSTESAYLKASLWSLVPMCLL